MEKIGQKLKDNILKEKIMKLEAGTKRVLCIQQEKPKTTEAGLHIPDSPSKMREPYIAGIIIASNSEKYKEETLVYFDAYNEIMVGPNKIYAVKEEDILCVLIPEAADLEQAKSAIIKPGALV